MTFRFKELATQPSRTGSQFANSFNTSKYKRLLARSAFGFSAKKVRKSRTGNGI